MKVVDGGLHLTGLGWELLADETQRVRVVTRVHADLQVSGDDARVTSLRTSPRLPTLPASIEGHTLGAAYHRALDAFVGRDGAGRSLLRHLLDQAPVVLRIERSNESVAPVETPATTTAEEELGDSLPILAAGERRHELRVTAYRGTDARSALVAAWSDIRRADASGEVATVASAGLRALVDVPALTVVAATALPRHLPRRTAGDLDVGRLVGRSLTELRGRVPADGAPSADELLGAVRALGVGIDLIPHEPADGPATATVRPPSWQTQESPKQTLATIRPQSDPNRGDP